MKCTQDPREPANLDDLAVFFKITLMDMARQMERNYLATRRYISPIVIENEIIERFDRDEINSALVDAVQALWMTLGDRAWNNSFYPDVITHLRKEIFVSEK